MDDINKVFAEQELSPVDAAFPDLIFHALTRMGFSPFKMESGTVCAELTVFGEVYALAHFASAREVFYTDEHVLRNQGRKDFRLYHELYRKFRTKQSIWADTDDKKYARVDKYLFVVDYDGVSDDDSLYGVLKMEVENDMYVMKKVLCNMDSLRGAVSSPFAPVAHRANDTPEVHCTRASIHPFDKAPLDFDSTVTSVFKPADYDALVATLANRGNRKAIQAVTAALFQRIMGKDYSIVAGDEWPEVSRGPKSDHGMPYFMLSRGEQVALPFCLYLALAHDAVTEGMCIGISESLNALDSLRQLNAYDCLRHFIIATGASVYIRTDKTDCLQMAERKLVLAKTLARRAGELVSH